MHIERQHLNAGDQGRASRFQGDKESRDSISSEIKDAWDNWGTLAAALALLCAEWILRKRWELV